MLLKTTFKNATKKSHLSKQIVFKSIEPIIYDIIKKKYKELHILLSFSKRSFYRIHILYNIINDRKYYISIKFPFKNIPFSYLTRNGFKVKIGDIFKKYANLSFFLRSYIRIFKSHIRNIIRLEENKVLLESLKPKIGKLLSGFIKNINKNFLIVSLTDRVNGILYKNEMMSKDFFKKNDNIKVFFKKIVYFRGTPEIYLSRTCNEIVLELLKLEIPEIKNEIVEVKGIARIPGVISKISVTSKNSLLDPVGVCIGIGGSRIQNVSKQLCNERIELIIWDKDIMKYIINIFSDIEIKYLEMEENGASLLIVLKKNDFLKVTSKNSQILRIAEKLTGLNFNLVVQD